jgi:hypothetical protein
MQQLPTSYKLQVSTLLLGSGINGEQRAGLTHETSVMQPGLPPSPYEESPHKLRVRLAPTLPTHQ